MRNSYGIDSKVLNYLMEKRKPEVEPLPSNDNQMIAAMADASAKLGTLGGQSADTSGVQNFANMQDKRNMQERQLMTDNRNQEDSRQLAIAGLLDKYKSQKESRLAASQEKQADRDFKLALADKNRGSTLRDQITLDNAKTQNKMALAEVNRQNQPKKLGKAAEAVDKAFAKEYSDFVLKGKEGAAQSINMLEGYVKQLEDQEEDMFQSGGGQISSILPDAMRSSESIKLRDDITGIAMQGLKDVFGGAISDGERKALAATFYNDKIPPNENISILKRKLGTLKDIYANKLSMAQHYENTGTLEGFRGINSGDLLSNLREKDPVGSSSKLDTSDTAYAATPPSPKPSNSKKTWSVGEEATNPNTGKLMVKGQDGLWYEKGE